MNRYSDYSVSSYDPMSFQDIMAVPLLKRQQHNEILAKQELIRAGLAKVDPLKEHLEEALRLKQGIESQMDNTALELSKNGINNDMIGKTIALNRQYQDMVSPTGRIGQINQAKIIEAQTKKEFMDSPELKEYGLDAKQKAWDKHRLEYTGYDKEHKNITNISALSGPKYEDMQKDFTDLASKLGEETKTYLKNSGAHFKEGPFGGLIMVSGDGKTINTNNDANLKSLADVMSAKYVSSNGSGYKSREFAGFDKQNTIDQLNGMMGIPRVNKSIADMNYNYNYIGDPNSKKETSEGNPSYITDPVDAKETITDSHISDVEALGNKTYSLSQIPPKNRYETQEDYKKRISNIKYDPTTKKYNQQVGKKLENLTPELQKQVQDIYNAKKAQGIISKNDKLTDYNPKTIKIISKELKRLQTVNFSNQIIIPDSEGNATLASPQLINKEAKDRNGFIQTRLRSALNEDSDKQPQIIFNKDGSEVDLDDVDIDSVKLNGHYSPMNKLKNFGGNPENNISPHQISWKDKNGKDHTGLMPRDASETVSPLFKAARIIKKTTDRAVDNEGNFTSFNKINTPELENADLSIFGRKDRGLNGMRVKYNQTKKTYTIEIIDKNNKSSKIEATPEIYQNIMYDMIE